MRRWWRLWWDRDVLCAVHRSQWRLCCGKGMTKQIVLVCRNLSKIWTRENLTTFGLQPVTTLFERRTECEYIHSKGNCPLFQMPCLAKSYDTSVVSYLAWKLGVTFFLNHPVLIFIHQTISTYHNKVTKAWRYTSQFWYNRTLGIILILDSCHETWGTTYIPNENSNYGPGPLEQ